MKLKVKAVSPKIGRELPWPSRATAGSAGMDLSACIEEDIIIAPRQLVKIPTGIAIALPGPEYVALVFSLTSGVGVIDGDYRGEIMVGLTNLSEEPYTIHPGDRIAQLVVTPVVLPQLELMAELDETDRGTGGFGSTGQ